MARARSNPSHNVASLKRALAEKEASEAKAEAIRTLAKANRENYEAEAAGKRALNEAM